MTLRWILFILVVLNWYEFSFAARKLEWLLYSNDDKNISCLLYDFRYYSRSATNELFENQTDRSCINGKSWSFSKLNEKQVTTDDLVDWLIPFDTIEKYVYYQEFSSLDNSNAICNCSKNYIGPQCEYRLISEALSIYQLLSQQLSDSRVLDADLPTLLIDGIICNAGALNIEWRQICDGIINCQDGIDEFDCHLLEFNQCEFDEFQCRNGMCIPKEFLFDTEIDCMDSSDEQELYYFKDMYISCPRKSSSLCDERLCRKDQFSCGDGQCVNWSTVINHLDSCKNLRDIAYLCETSKESTGSEGICQYTTKPLLELTNTSDCVTSLRYLLLGDEIEIALNNIIHSCQELIQYPEEPVLSPALKMFYNKSLIIEFYNHSQNYAYHMPKKPHIVCFSGSMICNGKLSTLQKDYCISYDQFEQLASYPFFPIPYLFCQMMNDSHNLLKPSASNQPTLSSFYTCMNTSDRLSLRRLNDGYFDCLYRDDERNSLHKMVEPYRYRCETVLAPTQYISFQQLGNGINECPDGSDEISRELRWTFLRCSIKDNYACWVFQGDGINENRIKDVRLPFYRYCDSIWDTMDGRDEQNCSQWMCLDGMIQCNRTGQCIIQSDICDEQFDCDDGEDELNCQIQTQQWLFELDCNRSTEHFCIPLQYLQNGTVDQPCISYSRVGDGKIDCVGGRDERNTFSCSDHTKLGDRFVCDNQTKCIDYTKLCNDINDCFDRTDEIICFWHRYRCAALEQLDCSDELNCNRSQYNLTKYCSNSTNWFWHSKSLNPRELYRSQKDSRTITYTAQCYRRSTDQPAASLLSNDINIRANTMLGYCNRGFYVTMNNGKTLVCFCPPSFYGNRCQFNSRRVTVRVQFERRHRYDIPPVLNVLVLLLLNKSVIVDHQRFVDIYQDFSPKHNVYLLYQYNKPQGFYSIRLEAYDSINFLAAWEYSVSPLDFLPSLRIAKILRFPDRPLPWLNFNNQCKNNGTSYYMNNDQQFCLCQQGWQGMYCETKIDNVKCASHSFARDRHICICPPSYLPPHCIVRNTICERTDECLENHVCYPLSIHPPNQYTCICNNSLCNIQDLLITMHRKESNQLPFLLQLLKLTTDHTNVRQQILIDASTNFPMTTLIKMYHMRYRHNGMPEIGLLFTFQPDKYSVTIDIHLLFINCSDAFRNYSIDLDIQPKRCRSLTNTDNQLVQYFHKYCHHSHMESCFVSDGYICYCDSKSSNRTECFSYHQRDVSCTYCYNHGYCVQGDLQNKSDFVCVCPKCASGKLCQYSPSRFFISFELLIEKTNWGLYHFIIPIIFLLFSSVFNGFSIITFVQPKSHQTGSGFYLLVTSIISQLIIILLFIRIVYLSVIREILIEPTINVGLCKSLPFIMSSLNYISLWLMAFVTVERALAVTFPTRFSSLQKPILTGCVIILIFLFIFGTSFIHIHQYKLVTPPDEVHSWCINEIQQKQEKLIQYTSLAHRISPFLINLIAGLTIIIIVSRSKATSQHLTTRASLAKQTRERFDLLLAPIISFITQLPQLIIIFLDPCHYHHTSWFVHLTLLAYYISFVPQLSLFFLYVQPSPLFKKVFIKDTIVGKRMTAIIHQRRLNKQVK